MKVAIYTRVSTSDKGQTVENQQLQLRQWADRSGHEVVGEFSDQVSGRKGADKRDGLAAMLKAAHQRRFDVVLVWALDRLSREGCAAMFSYVQKLADCGVALKSYTEPMLDTGNRLVTEIIMAVQAAVAASEAEKMSTRVKAGIARKRRTHRDGAWGTRPVEQADPGKVARIRDMLMAGTGIGKTARILHVGTGTVHRIARELRRTGNQLSMGPARRD